MTAKSIDTQNKSDDEKSEVKTEETTSNTETEEQLQRARQGMEKVVDFVNDQRWPKR